MPISDGASGSVLLKPNRDRSANAGHPWVFSGALAASSSKLADGDLVDVFCAEGRYVATAHFGTQGGIALRLLSAQPIANVDEFIAQSLNSAVALRRQLGLHHAGKETNSYRVVNAEGDFLSGLVVDRYADTLVYQCHSTGMQRWKARVVAQLRRLEGVNRVVDRSPTIASEEGTGDAVEQAVAILEHGLTYQVSVSHGQKTGFFLDQRDNRYALQRLARGRRVLNSYCYTGGFSVNAVAGGAASVVSVDASKRACDAAEETVRQNFPAFAAHQVLHADCKEYLPSLAPGSFDLIVLDPPAFVKHQSAKAKGLKGYEATVAAGLRALASQGLLLAFSCSQLVTRDEFLIAVARAAERASCRVRILGHLGAAECHPINAAHPEGEYLKGVVLQRS